MSLTVYKTEFLSYQNLFTSSILTWAYLQGWDDGDDGNGDVDDGNDDVVAFCFQILILSFLFMSRIEINWPHPDLYSGTDTKKSIH